MPAVALAALLLEMAAPLADETLAAGGFAVSELEIEVPVRAGLVRPGKGGCGGIVLRAPDPFARPQTRFSRLRASLSANPTPDDPEIWPK